MQPPTGKLFIHIKSPEGSLFEGYVDALSSINEFGRFDVLVEHENFICIIREYITLYEKKTVLKNIKIDSGVLKATENKINIFLGIDTLNKVK
jgi:F0F1-type ATP synthase epsilon subunit